MIFFSDHLIGRVDTAWSLYMLTFLWLFIPKYLSLDSIRWLLETNFLNILYSGSTYLLHASSSSDWENICLLLFDFLSVNYHTFGYVASHSRDNYMSHFSSHPIRVVRLYDVLASSWLGTIRYDTIWYLLMYFLLTYFDRRTSCLNIYKIFPLFLEHRVSIYINILFLLSPLVSH